MKKKLPDTIETKEVGKANRLEIRIHPILKKALQEYCKKNLESTTEAVTNAIKAYVNFNKK
jgi:hypothetical protein